MKKAEYIKRYGEEWYEEHILKTTRKHHQDHKEEDKQYYQDHREEKLEYNKQWREEHKEEKLEYNKQWREEHKEEILEYAKQYYSTQVGRANHLLNSYRRSDEKYNRGECTLTTDWIINNIFTSKCVFCGESDWTKLGCDRIDNSLPHTIENVQCCCYQCNTKRGVRSLEEFLAKVS